MKKYLFGILYGLLLTAFTVYILLDTFVITRVYQMVSENDDVQSAAMEISEEDNPALRSSTVPVITENTYYDENISIAIAEYRQNETTIYVADVLLSSAQYLQTALAENTYGRNITQKTSEIAQSNHAILAINGDFYGSRESGFVLRNGVVFRENAAKDQTALVIYNDGSFEIITEENASIAELQEKGAQQVLSFGPVLVMDGEITVSKDDEVGKAKASNPRTAIGIVDELHYLLVVSDGRTGESTGLSLYELADFLQQFGAVTAYNLDGGGSSTMYFNGEIVNNPTSNGKRIKERSVSDIVYIGYV